MSDSVTQPTPPQTQSPGSGVPAFAVGDKVKILPAAVNYATTTTPIPARYKDQPYTVQQVMTDRVLIKELYSWVWTNDVIKA